MTTPPALLIENPWLGIAVCLTAFGLLFVVVQVLARSGLASAEVTRKLMHGGSGLLTLAFPFLFREVWPVVFLTAASAVVIGSVKFIPPLRRRFGRAVSGVGRATLGEIYFPVAVVWLFWLTLDEDPLLYVVPVLLLTFADATCALVGMRYGLTKYEGASKSLEGSVAFVVVAFLCVHVPLLLWSSVGRAESLLIATTLALIVMLLEGSAWRGLDNLFIPVGGYLLLRIYLTLEVDQLAARLAVALALVAVVVAARRSTTLEDDSLVAAAFLCYVAWALMGWRWLVPPIVVFVGYRWLSPATEDNRRRIHGVPAVLSVWAAAVGWLTLAHVRGDSTMLLPYTLVFAAHLAMFGISRLAFQYPDREMRPLMWRASVVSWVLVLIPYAVSIGIGTRTLVAAAVALPALGVGVVTFVRAQPDIRHARQDVWRWVTQAGGAALASLVGWAAWVAVLEGLP